MSGPTSTKVMDGASLGDVSLRHAGASLPELQRLLRERMERRVHGLCFSAYLPGQSPEVATQLSEQQIRDRLAHISPHCRWVRTFSCTDGNQYALRIARELGLKTMVGAWIGEDADKNERELEALNEVVASGHADLVAVGNEVLYREDLALDELIGWIERVKREMPGVPVGTVDAYYFFLKHPELLEACDQLLINCYPFWEEFPLEEAVAAFREMVQRVQAVAGGKQIVISETGWPTSGDPVGAAVPSLRSSLLYALDVLDWSEENGLPLFYFAAYDEDWKTGPEGDCGSSWGFWDAHGGFKHRA